MISSTKLKLGLAMTGGWTTHCLPLDPHAFSEMKWEPATSTLPAGPSFYKTEFNTPEAMDTFLATKGWTKGIACASKVFSKVFLPLPEIQLEFCFDQG